MSITVLIVIIALSTLALLLWALFLSKSVRLGEFFYNFNNVLRMKAAGLKRIEIEYKGHKYIYLSNFTSNKPIMLLLHGFSSDKTIWLPFAQKASKNYTLVIPDLLGHGEIPYDARLVYSTPVQAKYVEGLIEYLIKQENNTVLSIKGNSKAQNGQQPSFVLVGNSMGGMISAELNQNWQFEAQLQLTALLDPAGAKTDFARQMQANKHNPFVHVNVNTVFEFYQLAMNKPPFMPPSVFHYIAESKYLQKQTEYKHMFQDFFNLNLFYDKNEVSLQGACLIIWGEKDGLLPMTDATYWQKMSKVEPIILKSIGHMPMVECPEHTFKLIEESL